MSEYKLYYFNIRARAEVTRTLFAQAGVEYEDIRLTREQWGELKASGKAPFGQLPILEVPGGTVLGQSMTIMRYVAERLGLAPSSTLDKARADMIVDADMDIIQKMTQWYFEKNEEKKKSFREELFGIYLPQNLAYLEKLLKTNDEGKGFFVGDKLTYADIHFFTLINGTLAQGETETPEELHDLLKGFPRLRDLYDRVLNQPNVLNWLQTRPESDM